MYSLTVAHSHRTYWVHPYVAFHFRTVFAFVCTLAPLTSSLTLSYDGAHAMGGAGVVSPRTPKSKSPNSTTTHQSTLNFEARRRRRDKARAWLT